MGKVRNPFMLKFVPLEYLCFIILKKTKLNKTIQYSKKILKLTYLNLKWVGHVIGIHGFISNFLRIYKLFCASFGVDTNCNSNVWSISDN